MAEEITVIGIGVDTSQVNAATDDLDRFAATGGRVESAASALSAGLGKIDAAAAAAGRAVSGVGAATAGSAAQLERTGNAVTALAGALSGANSGLGSTAAGVALISTAAGAAAGNVGGLGASAGTAAAGLADIVRVGDAAAQSMQRASGASGALVANLDDLGTSRGASGFVSLAELEKVGTSLGATTGAARGLAAAVASIDTSELDRLGTSLGVAQTGATGAAAALAGIKPASLGGAAEGIKGIGTASKLTASQAQQLSFQLNDLFVQIASGGSPLTALIQQGSQLNGTFGGLRGTLSAVGSVFTVARVAIGGVVAALGAVALAWYQGQSQSAQFAKDLRLSGNYAGQTEAAYNSLARTVAQSTGATVSSVREMAAEIIRTGQIGPQAFASATAAAVGYGAATGKTAQEVAKDFADMGRAPSKFAADANRSLNFLSAAQYQAIKAFEDNGRAAEAQGVIYDALNARFGNTRQNLGTLERALAIGKSAWAGFWDSAFDIGRTETIDQKIEKTAAKIRALQPQTAETGGGAALVAPSSGRRRTTTAAIAGDLQAEQTQNYRSLFRQAENATAEALRAETNKQAIAADSVVDSYLKRGKAALGYAQKLQELNRSFRAKEDAGVPVSADDRQVALAQLEKDFSQTGSSAAAALAKIEGQGVIAAQRLAGQLQGLQAQLDQGLQSQIGYLEEVAAAEVKALEAERARLGAQRPYAQPGADAARLDADITAKSIEIDNRRRKAIDDITAAKKRQADAIYEAIRAQQQESQQESNDYEVARSKAIEEARLAQFASGQTLKDEAELLEREISLLGASSEQRQVILEQLRTEQKLRKDIEAIKQNLLLDEPKREELIAEATRQSQQASAQARSRIVLDEWSKTTAKIEDSLTDALLRGFENGKGFIKNLRDTIVNIFSTMVLRPVVSAIVQPVAGALSSAVGGLLGQQQTGAAAQQYAQYAQLASTAYKWAGNAYNTVAGYFGGGSASAVGAGGQTVATGAASSGTTASSTGMGGVSWGSLYAAFAVWAYGQSQKDYEKGFTGAAAKRSQDELLGKGAGSFSIETVVGKALSAIGLSDKWSSILSGGTPYARIFGRADPRITAAGVSGSFSGGDFSGNQFADILQKGGFLRKDKRTTEKRELGDDLEGFFDAAAKGVFEKARDYGKALNLPTEQLAAITKDIRLTLGDDAEANKKSILEALGGYGDALVAGFADSLATVKLYGETVTQTIERVAGTLLGVNDVLKLINVTALETSVAGGGAAVELAGAFDGLQNLQQAAGGYFDRYFSDQEKALAKQKQVTAVFAEYGATLPESRAAFRGLVEAQDLTTESGRAAFAALLSVAGAFDELQTSLDAAGKSALALRKVEIQQQLDDIEKVFGDFSLLDEKETVSQQLAAGRSRLEELQTGLSAIMGGVAKTVQETLAALVESLRNLKDYRAGLADSIADARNAALPRTERIAALRGTESDLFAKLATAEDPAAVAQRLQDVILDRIQQEASLSEDLRETQIKALRDQIDGYERLRDLAESLAQFTGGLRISDASPLSYQDQLFSARQQFDSTLAKAQGGDKSAQSNLTNTAKAYLDEARAYFGSSSAYADIFAQVTGSLDALGGTASTSDADVQLLKLEGQLKALEDLNAGQGEVVASSRAIVAGLTALDAALAAREDTLAVQIDTQKTLAQQQIDEQKAINASLTAQLVQAQAGFEALKAELEHLNSSVDQLVTNADIAAAVPS